jgi:predicted ABC-type ATPase
VSAFVERPKLWIVAGPNGSGKSSLYTGSGIEDFGRSVWIINPDVLSLQSSEAERCDLSVANLEAVKRIYAWLEASVAAYRTVGVETVLSTGKYRGLVTAAKSRGFEVRLIYVLLKNAQMNVERVRVRVAKGGHAVPEDKIVARREKSLAQLPWFLGAADSAWIFDNSGSAPQLVASKATSGVITVDPAALPEIKKAARLASDIAFNRRPAKK